MAAKRQVASALTGDGGMGLCGPGGREQRVATATGPPLLTRTSVFSGFLATGNFWLLGTKKWLLGPLPALGFRLLAGY